MFPTQASRDIATALRAHNAETLTIPAELPKVLAKYEALEAER